MSTTTAALHVRASVYARVRGCMCDLTAASSIRFWTIEGVAVSHIFPVVRSAMSSMPHLVSFTSLAF